MNDGERKRACNAAKAALEAYANDPSQANAAGIEVAWQAVRKFDAKSIWQQWKEEWLGPMPDQLSIEGGGYDLRAEQNK